MESSGSDLTERFEELWERTPDDRRGYKILTADRKSPVPPESRTPPCKRFGGSGLDVGRILHYPKGEEVRAEDDLFCDCLNRCCHGLHMFVSEQVAKDFAPRGSAAAWIVRRAVVPEKARAIRLYSFAIRAEALVVE